MKRVFILIAVTLFVGRMEAQENYCDFEFVRKVTFAEWNGRMDTGVANPLKSVVNRSHRCARYIRDTATYDNFKMYPFTKLVDVSPYASSAMQAPKIKIKVFTNAPAGTPVQLQLGTRSNTGYPDGVHSVYSAITTVSREWEVITFNYMMPGGHQSATDIDKIVILFNPASHSRDTVYFDDPTGPETIPVGLAEYGSTTTDFKLFQNKPNPARESTGIKLQINSPGYVSLKLFDILGKPVSTLLDQEMVEGTYSVPLETSNFADGIYLYVLKKEGLTQTKRMIISK